MDNHLHKKYGFPEENSYFFCCISDLSNQVQQIKKFKIPKVLC